MSFISHVNNTCFIPPIKNTRVATTPNHNLPAQKPMGIINKISHEKPSDSATSSANLESATPFAMTAACYFASKAGKIYMADTQKSSVLCGMLSPAVQAAGNYVYQKTIQDTSDVPLSSSQFSSLSPFEEAVAGTLGAATGYLAVAATALPFLSIQNNPLGCAAVALNSAQLATKLANSVKQTYSSLVSSPAEERAPTARAAA